MGTCTSAAYNPSWKGVKLWLNGKEEDANTERIQNCLREIQARSGESDMKEGIRIVSTNNFPTAAGLASSASGYACLVAALGGLFKVEGDLSVIARQGSGSACRSMYGGFVKWEMGKEEDGSDSIAVQVAPETHWPSLHALILVVSDEKKKVSSTGGMEESVRTSKLLAHRAQAVVPDRMVRMEQAIKDKDFAAFGKLTMEDSNQFHATCLDTWPPIFYLNDTSRAIIQFVHAFNEEMGQICAAYTFDAGPNAVLFVEEANLVKLAHRVSAAFPPSKDKTLEDHLADDELRNKVQEVGGWEADQDMGGRVKYIIHTKVGCGPSALTEDESLIDLSSGLPK
mmetsp:Transcript_4948/g.17914  ORF Transcript_4948/g.17914 Transcript_4948/m.17914 type:complete len:340 (-) Transcript_4948:18-1037(-)